MKQSILIFFACLLLLCGCKDNSYNPTPATEEEIKSFSEAFSEKVVQHQLLFLGEEVNHGVPVLFGGRVDGGTIALPYTSSGYGIQKYGVDRDLLWEKELPFPANAYSVLKVVAGDDGGFALLCTRNPDEILGEVRGQTPRIIRFNKDGIALWEKTYDGFGYSRIQQAFCIGNEVVTVGNTIDEGQLYFSKLDSNGQIAAERTIDAAGTSCFYAAYTPEIGIVVLLNTTSDNDFFTSEEGECQGVLAVFDPSFQLRWYKTFSVPFDNIHQVCVTAHGLYLIPSDTDSNGRRLLNGYSPEGEITHSKVLEQPVVGLYGTMREALVLYSQTHLYLLDESDIRDGMEIDMQKIPFSANVHEIIEAKNGFYVLSTRYETLGQESGMDALLSSVSQGTGIKDRVYSAFSYDGNLLWQKGIEMAIPQITTRPITPTLPTAAPG